MPGVVHSLTLYQDRLVFAESQLTCGNVQYLGTACMGVVMFEPSTQFAMVQQHEK